MLNIYFGEMPEAIRNTSMFFKNVYLDEWFDNPLVRKMIKSVDKGEVLGSNAIDTKALGVIAPTKLSGGVKTLMLMLFYDDKVFNASNCGDNCAKWILEIAKEKDLTINLHHLMDFGNAKFEVKILNNGEIAHSMNELIEKAIEYI